MSSMDQPPTIPTVDQQGEAASFDGEAVGRFVSAAADLAAKPGSHQDSWFLTAHLASPRGMLDLLVHILHVVPPGGVTGQVLAMVSVLDAKTGRYFAQEQDFASADCSFAADRCEVVTPIARLGGTPAAFNVSGTWAEVGISCDVTVSQAGPMLANLGGGLFPVLGGITYHYALPTMTTVGTVTVDGETVTVSGPAWLDRQWGMTPGFFDGKPKKWIWFSLSLDDGVRVSIWETLEDDRQHRFATVLHPDGRHVVVAVEPLLAAASRPWTSPATGNTYPTAWEIVIPALDGRVTVAPEVIEQEFVSPSKAHKYEGSSAVSGTLYGKPVGGFAVIELVGDWS